MDNHVELTPTASQQFISERFVAPEVIAEYLSCTRRRVLDLTRAGVIRGYPLGTGQRCQWRFRLSEVLEDIARRGIVADGGSQKAQVIH